MRKQRILIGAIVLAAIFALAACGAGNGTETTSTGGTQTTAGNAGTSVSIEGFAFSPAVLTIPVGTTVTWTNNDGTNHTVTSDGGAFDSGALGSGDTFQFTFDEAGSYPYHCTIHPNMTGTIVVEG